MSAAFIALSVTVPTATATVCDVPWQLDPWRRVLNIFSGRGFDLSDAPVLLVAE